MGSTDIEQVILEETKLFQGLRQNPSSILGKLPMGTGIDMLLHLPSTSEILPGPMEVHGGNPLQCVMLGEIYSGTGLIVHTGTKASSCFLRLYWFPGIAVNGPFLVGSL